MSWFKKFIAIGSLVIIFGALALIITIGITNPTQWWWVVIPLLCLYGFNIIFAVYVFYSKRRNSVEKKCWMMILIVFPILGVIAFLKYGFNPFHKTNLANQIMCRDKLNIMDNCTNKPLDNNSDLLNCLIKYCINVTHTYPSDGNVKMIKNIEDLYKISIESIRNAKHIIFINFYIIRDGVWLRTIANELKKKAAEGVKVYFLFDWGGSNKRYPKVFVKKMREAGITINIFRPKRLLYISGYDNSRSHKKLVIVDDKICLYGGFNLADEYINYSKEYAFWNDDGFIITGNVIREYIKSFVCDWVIYSDHDNSKDVLLKDIKRINLFKPSEIPSTAAIQLFDSNPELIEYQMINFLIMCLTRAQKRIWINTPYLYPTEYLINVLIGMAQSDVDIRIIVPGISDDKKFILALNRSQYKAMIKAGIKIYELNAFNHSKAIIIDDDISLIGTCNLDPRAMNLNYENISVVNNNELNHQLSEKFLYNISKAREIGINEWKHASLKDKILVKILLLLEPLF